MDKTKDILQGFGDNPRNKHIYTFRYLIKFASPFGEKAAPQLGLKIISETYEGHQKFVDSLKLAKDVLAVGREYCSEVDPSLVGIFENIKTDLSEGVSEENKIGEVTK